MEEEQESDMSAQAAGVETCRVFIYKTFTVYTNSSYVFGLVHNFVNFGNSVVSRRLMVNPQISTFGFGYTGFNFSSH